MERGQGWHCVFALLLLASTLSTGCGSEPPAVAAQPGRLGRLRIVATDTGRDLDVPLTSFTGELARPDAAAGRPAHVKLEGRRRKRIRIPVPVDLRPFEQVELQFVGDAAADLDVRLAIRLDPTVKTGLDVEHGFARTQPTTFRLASDPTGTRVTVDVPSELRTTQDELWIQIDGRPPAGFGLAGVRFAERANGWVEIGGDRRVGRWIVPGRDLAGRALAAALLMFDYHLSEEDESEPPSRLLVSIGDEEVASLGPSGAGWEHVELALPATIAAGSEVEVRFALEAPGGAAAAIADGAFCEPQPAAATVLLVTSDTHRADHLGITSPSGDVQTPVLDALAARGVVFLDAFASSNVTVPSHAALLTGVHPRDSNASDNRSVLADSARTLAESFKDAGWMTFASVSAGFLGAVNLHQGFDRLSAPASDTRPADPTIAALERWLPDADGKPLFVWLHVFDAHSPYEPPQEFIDRHWSSARDPRDPAIPNPAFADLELPPGSLGVRDLDYIDACYRAEVSYLDDQLERVLLRARFASGVVAVTADHGECLGTHGGWHHRETLPHTLHVPLILAWPEAPAGTFVEEPVLQIDVGRTLLALAGVDDPEFPGSDLRSAEARAPKARFALAGERRIATVVTADAVLVLHLVRHDEFERHTVQLFDRPSDPDCLADLAATEHARARKLRAILIEWLLRRRQVEDGVTALIPLEELRALGYAYGEAPELGEDWFDSDCDCERCVAFR